MKDEECMFRDCPNGLVIASFSFAILYTTISRSSLPLSSRLHQFMSQTLNAFLNITALYKMYARCKMRA